MKWKNSILILVPEDMVLHPRIQNYTGTKKKDNDIQVQTENEILRFVFNCIQIFKEVFLIFLSEIHYLQFFFSWEVEQENVNSCKGSCCRYNPGRNFGDQTWRCGIKCCESSEIWPWCSLSQKALLETEPWHGQLQSCCPIWALSSLAGEADAKKRLWE